MAISRRRALLLVTTFGFAPLAMADPQHYLWGTFYLKCPYCGHIDKVEEATAQHACENPKCRKQVFKDGKTVIVMCPNWHANEINLNAKTESVICKVDQVECCRKRFKP